MLLAHLFTLNLMRFFITAMKSGFRVHPLTKGCIRKMKQMIDILDKVSIKASKKQTDHSNQMDKIWELSTEMAAKLLHKGKNKSEVSEMFIQDLARFYIQTKSCKPTLIQAKQRYETMKTDSKQMGKASREINPRSITVNITETPKREELKINNILTKETFLKAKAIWSAQQALKTVSEVENFCNLKMKRNHQIKQGHFKFAKSRLINIEQAEQSGKTITDLIHSHGIYTHCLLLDTFSPISFAIAKEYHNDGSIIDRPLLLTKHNSIDLVLIK